MAANGVLNEMWTTNSARLGMRGSFEVRSPNFRSVTFTFSSSLLKVPLVLQGTAKKCTKNHNARAQSLFCSLNLLFSDVAVAVAVAVVAFLNSLLLG